MASMTTAQTFVPLSSSFPLKGKEKSLDSATRFSSFHGVDSRSRLLNVSLSCGVSAESARPHSNCQRRGKSFLPRAGTRSSDATLSGSAKGFEALPEQGDWPQGLSASGLSDQSGSSIKYRKDDAEAAELLLRQNGEGLGGGSRVNMAEVQASAGTTDKENLSVSSAGPSAGLQQEGDNGVALVDGPDGDEAETVKKEDEAEVDEEDDDEGKGDLEFEAGFKMTRVCDRLIEVFWIERPDPQEWRKLLAFSEEWARLRSRFFERCKERAGQMEDPKKKETLFRLARRLKEVDDDMERHNELVRTLEGAEDIATVVSHRRKDFTTDFFEHLHVLIQANTKDPVRRDELASLAAKCLTAVTSHDKAMSDEIALENAQQKLSDILNSPDLTAACGKIDELASKNQLDPTLMLLITKAWVTAKESNMMKEEVKDVMFHLYNVARGNMQRLVPPEVRILRHLITLEDPRQQMAEITSAFSPGDQLQGNDIDYLSTTPEKLINWINIVLNAYYSNQEGSLMMEAQRLMKPNTITKIELLKTVIEKEFM